MKPHRGLVVPALPLLLAACGSGSSTSSAPAAPAAAPAALTAALLTLTDLPSGYAVAGPYVKPTYHADPPACGEPVAVDALVAGPRTAVAGFENVPARSRIVEALHQVDDPAAYLKTIRGHLVECRHETVTDRLGRRSTIDGELTTGETRTGAFVMALRSTGALTEDETLVGQPAGKNVVILVVTGPTPPDSQETTYLVRAAVARAQRT